MKRLVASLFALCLALSAFADLPVARDGKALTVVVCEIGSTPAEAHVAIELQIYLSKITGVKIPIILNATEAPRWSIVVGSVKLAPKLLPHINFKTLGLEQTVLESVGTRLVVAGGRPRGTVYAVDRLLHRLGVRWWAPWATTIPRLPNLVIPTQHESVAPAFEYRDAYWSHALDPDWAGRNYGNGLGPALGDWIGGGVNYAGFVHTYYALVPPAKLFSIHPEWFSLINGKRVDQNAQLCTTNPQLRDYVVEQVRATLRANPDATIVSVSQNDCFSPCQCPNCRALAEKEGSDSALVLDLANYVAGKLGKEFPKVAFDTLAYQWSRKPPRTMRPLPNVIVRLCSIECNFSYPLNAPKNASFAADVDGWSRLTKRLYIWDYCTNFANYIAPQPDYFTFGETFKFLHDHGTKGIFEEGDYQSSGGDMAELKAWVMSQLFWNPDQDSDHLVREFLAGYYGDAAKPIYSYLRFMEKQAQTGDLGFAGPVAAPFLKYANMRQAESFWNDAESAVATQPDFLWRVRQSHLSTQYIWLCRWAEFKKAAGAAGDRWPWPTSRQAFAAQWLQTATGPGPAGWHPMTHVREGGESPQQFVGNLGADPALQLLLH